eukprot:2835713-Alexandrium_andersonii.AAC.1
MLGRCLGNADMLCAGPASSVAQGQGLLKTRHNSPLREVLQGIGARGNGEIQASSCFQLRVGRTLFATSRKWR